MKNRSTRFIAILLALVCILMCTACAGSEPDPNAGVYSAYTAEMFGLKIGVDTVYPDGFTIELKNGGKCKITIGSDSANGKWTLDGTDLNVSGGGIELEGTLENSLMTFDNVADTGLTMTFLLDGAEPPAYTSAQDILDSLEALTEEIAEASK